MSDSLTYVDGFVAPVPTANRAAYLEHARLFAGLSREQGALSVTECWGDDVPEGKRLIYGGFAVLLQQ